jgi:hypothetical protein
MRTVGPNHPLMAQWVILCWLGDNRGDNDLRKDYSFHYAYGNLERAQNNPMQAKRSYEAALKILLENASTHVLTSSTLYKLACIEESQGNTEKAK